VTGFIKGLRGSPANIVSVFQSKVSSAMLYQLEQFGIDTKGIITDTLYKNSLALTEMRSAHDCGAVFLQGKSGGRGR
jgi:sugar/nucleoside kinase (ribokinase family)